MEKKRDLDTLTGLKGIFIFVIVLFHTMPVTPLIVCYMAYYLVVYIARNKTQYFCLLAFGIVWGYSIAISGWKPPLCFGRNGESFMLFFIGCVIAEVYPLIRERQHRILQPTAFIGLAVSAVLLLRYGVEVISGDVGVAFAFFVCPLTLYLALGKNLFSWVLKCKLILWMGRISASVFFWHAVVYIYFCYIWGLCFGGVPIGDVQYAGYLVILVTLCFLSYRFLENRHHKQTASSGCHHT